MASVNVVSRSPAGAIGPTAATAGCNIAAGWTPQVGSAPLNIGYDLSHCFTFRNVRPPEEEECIGKRRQAREASTPGKGAGRRPGFETGVSLALSGDLK